MAGARRPGPLAGINVTPMADIIVVLLIIFMIAVPTLSRDPGVKLPDAQNAVRKEQERVVVTATGDGRLRIGGRDVSEPELLLRLQEALGDAQAADRIVYVRADHGLPYSRVERVLDLAKQAGSDQVAIMTEPRPR